MLSAAVCLVVSFVVRGAAAEGTSRATDLALADDCGAPLTKSDGSRWQCTLADDFTGTRLDRSLWIPQVGSISGTDAARACVVDGPNNIAVGGGELRLTVRKAAKPSTCHKKSTSYTSGGVMTYRTFSQQYGRIEARIKSTATNQPGLQEAFWLWPDDRVSSSTLWPAAGEIDIVETYSQYHYLAVPFLHYTWYDNGGPIPGLNTAWNCRAARGVYNTYTLTWTPDMLKIDVNGTPCLVNRSGDQAFKKPYIMALTSALGVGSNALRATTPLPATMAVDYVKVWR